MRAGSTTDHPCRPDVRAQAPQPWPPWCVSVCRLAGNSSRVRVEGDRLRLVLRATAIDGPHRLQTQPLVFLCSCLCPVRENCICSDAPCARHISLPLMQIAARQAW